MDIGIQSNIWSADIHRDDLSRLLSEVAQSGYAGIEIGVHRFKNMNNPESFLALVKNEGLHVSGIHTLVKLYGDDDLDYAKRAADFSKAVETQYMLVSGEAKDGKNHDDYKSMADILNKVGDICQERDLMYIYHNHWFEIENQADELRAICKLTDPKLLSLCLDIGWVARVGESVKEITTEFLDRIVYFHLKDTTGDKFTDLGDGDVDFPAWLAVISSKGDFYLTHERDEELANALASAKRSREYLRSIGL